MLEFTKKVLSLLCMESRSLVPSCSGDFWTGFIGVLNMSAGWDVCVKKIESPPGSPQNGWERD